MMANVRRRTDYDCKLKKQHEDYIRNSGLSLELKPGECHPLHWACSGNHFEIFIYLLEACNIPVDMCDQNGATSLMIAASAGDENIVKVLIKRNADINKTDHAGQTALHYAVKDNRVKITEILLLNNADVNAMDFTSQTTPLFCAASKGHLAIARSLIEEECKLDCQNLNGDTPLHIACREERQEIAELLLFSGASSTLRNKQNMTAFYMAPPYLKRMLDDLVALKK